MVCISSLRLLTRAAPLLQPLLFALASLMLVVLGMYSPVRRRSWAGLKRPAPGYVARHLAMVSPPVAVVTSLPRPLGLGALWGCAAVRHLNAQVLLTALALSAAGGRGAAVLGCVRAGHAAEIRSASSCCGGSSGNCAARAPRACSRAAWSPHSGLRADQSITAPPPFLAMGCCVYRSRPPGGLLR